MHNHLLLAVGLALGIADELGKPSVTVPKRTVNNGPPRTFAEPHKMPPNYWDTIKATRNR